MNAAQSIHLVELRCVGPPPVRQVERAAGVSGVETDGPRLRCLITGSFQPFLEALRGHEIIALQSALAVEPMPRTRVEGNL